jgi:hypothetical protein
MGDAIATNMFMLGYAFQKGQVPLQEASIMKAIELNGVSVPSTRPPSTGAAPPPTTWPRSPR